MVPDDGWGCLPGSSPGQAAAIFFPLFQSTSQSQWLLAADGMSAVDPRADSTAIAFNIRLETYAWWMPPAKAGPGGAVAGASPRPL